MGAGVSELQGRISSREFTEWMAYYQLEPFGEQRADLRLGIMAALFANANRDQKKRKKAYEPRDFMPQFEREEKTWQEQLEVVRMIQRVGKPKDGDQP